MRSILPALAVIGCGGDSPAGRELARLPGNAHSLQVAGDELIAVVSDPELIAQAEAGKTMRYIVFAVPLNGSVMREIARPPVGQLYAVDESIVYATTEGELLLLGQGTSRKIASAKAVSPVLYRGAVLAVADDPEDEKVASGVIRVDLETGKVARLQPSFSSIARFVHAAADDTGVFFTDSMNGETLRVSGERVERIAGPSGWVSCIAIGRERLWWIQREPTRPTDKPDDRPRQFSIMWMPPAGGKVTTAAHVSGFDAGCTSDGDGLIFFVDNKLMSIKGAEAVRVLARARGSLGAIAIDERAVYWTEPVENKPPFRHWAIRTLPLH